MFSEGFFGGYLGRFFRGTIKNYLRGGLYRSGSSPTRTHPRGGLSRSSSSIPPRRAALALLPYDADKTPVAAPARGRDDELEAGPPGDEDEGAAELGADGADGAVGGGFVEADRGREGGVDADGEGEGVGRRVDFLVGGVGGPCWWEGGFVSFFLAFEEEGFCRG